MNFKTLVRRTPPNESVVVLFGNPKDPDLTATINKIGITRRKTEFVARPSFDTGLGRCGKHLCSCKHTCMKILGGPGQQLE